MPINGEHKTDFLHAVQDTEKPKTCMLAQVVPTECSGELVRGTCQSPTCLESWIQLYDCLAVLSLRLISFCAL